MAYKATVIPVMIASPGDVSEEREVARETIHTWNYINSVATGAVLMPVGWETHSSPDLGGRPQEIINERVLQDCDLLVGIFWTRLGTPTGEAESGTVEEIEKHIQAGRPAMLYFSSKPVAPESINPSQYAAVITFKKRCLARGLVEQFDSLNEFRSKFSQQLQIAIHSTPYLKSLLTDAARERLSRTSAANDPVPAATLSMEAKILLKEASKGRGEILRVAVQAGRFIQTNGRSWGGEDRRESARWEYALQQLVDGEYVVARGTKNQLFELTQRGYSLADSFPDIIEA